ENAFTANTSRPVEQVSWNQIAGAGGFLSGTGLRLPTEAEWEYAYRAGTTTAFHGFAGQLDGTNDDTLVENIAWFSGNNGFSGSSGFGPKAVGQKLANGFGLHDMSGNVFEVVNDWYSSNYYESSPSSDPAGPAVGTTRVLRGGMFNNNQNRLRSSRRDGVNPGSASAIIGFRVARTVDSLPPTISSVSPDVGPTAGGTAITITGTNLTATTSVTIDGTAATSVAVVSATTVTAVTPAGTAGAKTVSLTTPGGITDLSNGFTYVAAPTVTSITPDSGATTGGAAVTIAGTGFTGATGVSIGGVAATSVVVVNATTITANAPALSAGVYAVAVTTPFGT
ncbi:MAG: SUMF1/EgtB/PvdO family nonheme iron enzyme, partial [Phycisphaerales bacterium]